MPETIGQQLKQARLAKNLSIEQVVQATHIRAHAVAALEADDFDSLPSPVQVRGFLKLYADFLGLSLTDMYARQRGDSSPLESASPADKSSAPEDEAPPELTAPSTQPKKPRSRKKSPSASHKAEQVPVAVPPSDEATKAVEPVLPVDEKVEAASLPGTDDQPQPVESMTAESPPPPVSQAVFNAIGEKLRQRRESLSLSLDEIERHTHVRKQFLVLLENGQFAGLPSSVQARGMLNNYARFLDLDVDAVLLEYAEGLQTQLAERQPRPSTERIPGQKKLPKFALPASIKRILSPDILVGGGMLILLVIFAIWGTGRVIRSNTASTPEPTAPSISNVLLASTPAGEPTLTAMIDVGIGTITPGPGATLDVTLPPAGEGAVQVVLAVTRNAWVKVVVDNVVEFEGRMIPGTAYAYSADTQIEVVTGDGSAVSIIYNQSNLGPMGAYGEVVDRIYTATTILLPTSTFTPTPTITQTPTITPRPSATPRPSLTPRPSATTVP